jgi:hypothetical protein
VAVPILRCVISVLVALTAAQPAGDHARLELAARVTTLTRATVWTRMSATPIRFKTHHPQGLVKIGDHLFLSSVEVSVPTRRLPAPVDGLDRDAGKGVGHLFQLDLSGNLIADLRVGDDAIYHPGGIDYDGRHLWVAVAEYRPNSRSIVYRVDPKTMTAVEIFRFADHLGAIVHNTDDDSVHGVSWGSRSFYRWPLGSDGRIANAAAPPESLRTANPSHYIDYQDCKFAGRGRMLCTGVAEMPPSSDAPAFRLGGLELVDLTNHRPIYQVPVPLWAGGRALTQNPVWLEATTNGLRGYFIPEDDASTLYVYDAAMAKTP